GCRGGAGAPAREPCRPRPSFRARQRTRRREGRLRCGGLHQRLRGARRGGRGPRNRRAKDRPRQAAGGEGGAERVGDGRWRSAVARRSSASEIWGRSAATRLKARTELERAMVRSSRTEVGTGLMGEVHGSINERRILARNVLPAP